MIIGLMTNTEIAKEIGKRCKSERILKEFSQEDLAKKANITYSAIKRFEQTGEISFMKLIQVVRVLGKINIFEDFLNFEKDELNLSYDELLIKQRKNKKKRVFKKKDDSTNNDAW